MINEIRTSPFTPGNPVPIELFVGRAKSIEETLRYIQQASSGKLENVFLEGERGIGKSSMASFLRQIVTTQNNMVGVHVFLGQVSTLEEMVHCVLNELLKEAQTQGWYEKVRQLFGKHISQVGLFNVSISFVPPKDELRELVRSFPAALKAILDKLAGEKSGLFIVLDDIDSLADKPEFANWYKSITDEITTHYPKFPALMMLVGYPEKRDALANFQPSLMRIFRVIEIQKLPPDDVHSFFKKAFDQVGISVKPEAMEYMVDDSGGLPVMMHEIGDAVFWANSDKIIDKKDAVFGILAAADNIGKKYLNPQVYRTLRSERYRSILRQFGDRELAITPYFTKREIEERLNDDERKVFNNFLRRMHELGVIEPNVEGGRGAYRFVNNMYPIYIWLENRMFRSKGRTP